MSDNFPSTYVVSCGMIYLAQSFIATRLDVSNLLALYRLAVYPHVINTYRAVFMILCEFLPLRISRFSESHEFEGVGQR